jgi:hypothetical protein
MHAVSRDLDGTFVLRSGPSSGATGYVANDIPVVDNRRLCVYIHALVDEVCLRLQTSAPLREVSLERA